MELEKPVSGTEGGGVGGYSLSRIQPGPGQAAQQDPKSQPQQSLQPGSMPISYPTNPRGGQPYYQARPQQRLQNNAPRMGPGMQGAVFALPSSNMFPQTSLVSGQVPTSILLPQVQYHMAARHHTQPSGQGGPNQQQNYFQLPGGYMASPQMAGPPPFSNYGPVFMQQPIRGQFPTPNSTQNQVPQQQPAPQQSSVQPLYVEQVGGGGPQVTISSMSGGPGGPNGTPHIMGPQAPNSISLVQNPAIPSGAAMMQNQQASKKIRKYAIPIIDPDSGQNVLLDEDKEGVSHSTDSSASHTPQPQISKEHDDIKAKQVVGEFAFKVAAVAFVGESASNAAAPAATPSAPPHVEERLNGPVDHSHENELVKEPSPAPPSAVIPQLPAPQMTAPQQHPTPPITAPHPHPALQLATAPQPHPPPHPPTPAFVPTVSASTDSPLVELHRPSPPSMSAVVKQLPPGSSGPPSSQQAPAPAPAPVTAHVPAPAPAPVPLPVTTPAPQASAPAPIPTPAQAPQPSPAPAQPTPPPQAPVTVRKPQVMGPPAESAAAPTKKAGKKEGGAGPGSGAGAGRAAPAGGRPGSSSTPPPAATTTVVGPPPAPAGGAPKSMFSEMTSYKNFAPSSNTSVRSQAPAPPTPAPAPAPAPTPVEEKGTNGETEAPVGKATQRPKQKKGGKVRGVDKGGTEMDAFVEPAPTPVAPPRDPTPPPPRDPTPPAPEPKARPVENSTAPVIEQLIQPEGEAEETGSVDGDASTGTDMDAMVAAKNEENAKVSAAAAAAAANNNNNITSSVEKEDEVLVDGEVDDDESNDIKSMTIERTPSASQALKYSYRDGQWSPVNRDGKKVYDRDFLLEIKNSTLARQKPEFNLELDIFRDRPNDHPTNNNRKNIHGSLSMGSRTDNPSPYRSSGSSSQRGSMIKMSGRPDRGGPQRIGPSLSQSGIRGMGGGKGGYISVNSQFMVREPEPVLHKDPNGWKPTRLVDGHELTEEQKQIEKLQKNVRGILNKLTPQKFEKLVGKILELPIDSEDHLREMVNLVFEKAVDEPSFSKAYADLCHRLQKKATQRMEGNNDNTTPTPVSVTFRKLLLNKCQEGFEKNKKDELDIANRTKEIEETPDPEKKKELKLLLEDDERRIRRKSVGLVRFIGELYKLQMLTPKIMHGCITTLLSQVAEESLECLCKLLTTIGKELERQSAKQEFDEYFAAMNRLAQKSNNSKVSSRIRFMLQDVIELRQKNWKPRRDENNPKTIEQIHKDAEREAIESAAIINTAPMHQGPKRHPGDGRRNNRASQDSDGWQMSSNKYRTSSSYTNTVEPAKLQHFKSDAGDAAISLGGSGTFSQWTLGASSKRPGFGVADSSRSGPPSSNNMVNRFAALGQVESTDSRMKYSSPMSGKGKGVSGSTSLEKDSRSIGGMMRDRDRDDNIRRMGSGPSSRENSRSRYAQPGHSPAGSLNSRNDRDFHRSEQPSSRGFQDNREATESRVPPANVPDLDEDEGARKADTIFDEWCANNNAEETVSTVGETFVGSNNIRLLVRSLLNKVIEGKPHSRTKFADLLVVILLDKKICSKKDVITEFQSLIEIGDDMVVDIPFFWSFFGQIFAPLVCNEVITIDDLKGALEDRPVEDRAKVVSEVFKVLKQSEMTSIWTSSKAKLTEFVPEKDIDNFVESNNFWFLKGNGEPVEEWRKHRDNLVKILQADSDKAMDEAHAFLAKIEGTVSKKAFIEIVTMAVIKASLKDDKLVGRLINKYDKLILKYVDNTEELELICLFAIKNFVCKEATLELPVLTESFRLLYDDSIISVEAFKKWKDDTSIEPAESEGRLLATRALEPFYVFLAEADEEEEEES